ncbi:SulP family inorganic anion transporter [Paeniglutamicibacter kerguelensis]|uniref:MFS superfamily sulfate permease-like transporter n=1 Tax=Paeniglutamicibacter kerguelensis TaxID=254788 RepID=A0ABS4XI60_9MICC|nr:SulP family inorganic anion transporter [Paeniglutamicibacter kerguelensis]MBP2388098.1 MFS superfamily sulfate permease-like transporter [Paeniglutamicibacter kerguelensis]
MNSTTGGRRGWLPPTLAGYQHRWLRSDILAGVSAGAVVIPQAMAYATIANLPVQIGLYTCMVPMLVYAMLGGSRAMSVSTTSTIATLTATTLVSAGVASGSEDAIGNLMMLTLLVGAILMLARLLKLGSIVENINKATITGIQVGVGATVAAGQLPTLFGVDSGFTGHGFIRSVTATVEALPQLNGATFALSAGSIATLFLLKRFAPRVPGPLVVVAAGILLVAFTGLRDAGVQLIDKVPQGLPLPGLPSFENIGALLPGALAISIMAFLESAAVARGIRQAGEHRIDSNQELLATAAANVAGSLFQTMPAAGGFSQSAVNQGAGAKSQFSGMVTVALAILVALFLGPVLSLLPSATLASLVFVAVFGLIDVKGLARLARISPREFWIALATAVVGLTVGLLAAVAVGVGATFGLLLHELGRVRLSVVERRGSALCLAVGGPLYTANALETENLVLRLAGEQEGIDTVVLDLTLMHQTSVTVLDTLVDLDHELAEMGIMLRLACVSDMSAAMAMKTAWYRGLSEEDRVFDSMDDAFSAPEAS